MMRKSRLDYISIKQILVATALIIVLIFIPFVFSSCLSEVITQFAEAGCKLNKVIYTNNMDKYMHGRTLATEIYNTNGELVDLDQTKNVYFLETDQLGVYDMVVTNIDKDGKEMDLLSATHHTHTVYLSYHPITRPVFDNNYIFSGIYEDVITDGKFVCTDSGCICGAVNLDFGDSPYECNCKYNNSNNYITVETELTVEEIYQRLNICPVCNSYNSQNNEDGTITYTRTTVQCSHGTKFDHKGNFYSLKKNYFGNSNPKELIIDGYDFSVFDAILKNEEVHQKWTNNYVNGTWQAKYKPESFAYMFSDLTVEKITIKNITGLGERAKDLSSMFENCRNLKTVDFGNLFEGCKPTNISRMFYNCPKLESVDLSSLDTSCVTDMSEMFALNGSFISAESRELELERMINKHIQNDEQFSEFNDGTIYTAESLIDKVYEIYGEIITKEYLYLTMIQLGEKIPLTYDEFCMAYAETDLVGFYNIAQQDPSQIGLPEKEEGETYNIYEIIKFVEDYASTYGIEVVHEMELQNNKSRDDMINFFINHTLVPTMVELDDDKTYNIKLISKQFNVPEDLVVYDIVNSLNEANSTDIPISYNEAACGISNGQITFEDIVTDCLINQEEYELPPKEDGSKYTRSEIENLLIIEIDRQMANSGLIIVTKSELNNYLLKHPVTAETLILGGTNSKFVVKNGTNVTNMFGVSSKFKTIVTPNEIGDEVEIRLSNPYSETDIPEGEFIEDETILSTTLTSKDANKTYYCYNEPKLEDSEKNASMSYSDMLRRKYFIMFIFSALLFTMVIMVIRITIRLNRRRRLKRFI